ncbi:MAG: Sec-independent protein translocase protein TatB [Pseudomonadota bacterium]|nr:Sec-independent protein translocase protein TatB [Pseudomonadota bacterium]
MFDVGISELALIGVVALIVLGPERLPKAARMAGALLRRLRGSWNSLRYELEREVASDELKRSLRDVSQAVKEANPVEAVRDVAAELLADANKVVADVKRPDAP